MPESVQAQCLDCGRRSPIDLTTNLCPHCGSQWLEARYPYAEVSQAWRAGLASRPFNLWRYRELLPLGELYPDLSMGEGGTPLIHAANLGMMLGLPKVYIKDERQGPTNSFKDRQGAVGIAALKEAGITEMVLASTGNVAIAYSAFAARAGIKLWAFLTSLVPAEKMREVAIYGTQVVKLTASYDQAKQVAARFAQEKGLYLERGARTIPSVEAMKTIAFEIAEQLGWQAGGGWQAPDWYFQSVSGGLGPLGVAKGFLELLEMGLIETMPKLACIQAEGCAPMVHAWRQNSLQAEPVRTPRTHIATLATGDPGRTYTRLAAQIQKTGGTFEAIDDEETYRTIHILAKMEGLSVEPAAAVAFAGLIRMARRGLVRPDETIVVNCTGHTMPVETNVVGESWTYDVALPVHPLSQSPEEGLLSALNQVTQAHYSRILIVDDTADARRLVRRILQAQGAYTLFEAASGKEALALSLEAQPDLIILDLMMPEMDGFAVLQALRADSRTALIPVIVVTAKELTGEEKARLRGQISALMRKGEFMSDELVDEIRGLVP